MEIVEKTGRWPRTARTLAEPIASHRRSNDEPSSRTHQRALGLALGPRRACSGARGHRDGLERQRIGGSARPCTPPARRLGQGASAIPTFAMVHAAIFDAVNAIDHRYKPYLAAPPAKSWYSQDAAVAAAAHRVLVSGHVVRTARSRRPSRRRPTTGTTTRSTAIPDSDAKTGGIATGEAAAWAMIAARTGDGRWGEAGFLPLADPCWPATGGPRRIGPQRSRRVAEERRSVLRARRSPVLVTRAERAHEPPATPRSTTR